MQPRAFSAGIVLAKKDLMSRSGLLGLEVVMDAVEHAVSAIPGISGIDICYLGARAPLTTHVWIRAGEDEGSAVGTGPWNDFLCREVEKRADRAIAELNLPRSEPRAA